MNLPHLKRSPRPEGGGDFAPALGGGSGAKRVAGDPQPDCLEAQFGQAMVRLQWSQP